MPSRVDDTPRRYDCVRPDDIVSDPERRSPHPGLPGQDPGRLGASTHKAYQKVRGHPVALGKPIPLIVIDGIRQFGLGLAGEIWQSSLDDA